MKKLLKILYLPLIFFYNELSILRKKLQTKDKKKFKSKYFKKIISYDFSLKHIIKYNKLILVESLVDHPAYIVKNLILANYLRKISNCEIILLINKNDIYARMIAKSFGIKKIIFFNQPNILQRIKNFIKISKIFLRLKNIEDLLKVKFNDTFIGVSAYDLTLREKKLGTYNKIDHNICYFLFKFVNSSTYFYDFFRNNKLKYLIIDEIQFYPNSNLFQSALVNKITCYVKAGNRKNITLRKYNNIKNCFENDSKFSKQLVNKLYNSKNKKKFISNGNKSMIARIYGKPKKDDIKDADHFKKGRVISKQSFYKKFHWDQRKPIGIILANDLTDGVTQKSWSLFRDNLSWLKFLLSNIKQNDNVNWIVKVHPSDNTKSLKFGTEYFFNSIIGTQKNVKLLPNKISARSLHKIVDFVFSSHGSAGLEYPFSKIPCITSAESLYSDFGFTHECKTLRELKKIIQNPLKIKHVNKKIHDLLCVYLDIYINRTKIEIGMPDFNPGKNINFNKFNKNLYDFCKQKKLYNTKYYNAFESQIKNSYRHTIDFSDLSQI